MFTMEGDSFTSPRLRLVLLLCLPLTLQARPPPPSLDFLVAGVQKSGTTALRNHLHACHPSVCMFPGEMHTMEPSYGQAYGQEVNEENAAPFYEHLAAVARSKGRCDDSSEAIKAKAIGVAPPPFSSEKKAIGVVDPKFSYLAAEYPEMWRLLLRGCPKVKVVLLLREPVQRAFSQYNMLMDMLEGKATYSFHSAVNCDTEDEVRHHHGNSMLEYGDYVARGFYDEQVEALFETFPKHRVKILISEDVFQDPLAVTNRLFDFLQVQTLEAFREPVFTRPAPQNVTPMANATYVCLRNIYRPRNARLYRLLGNIITPWEQWYRQHDDKESGRESPSS